MPRISIIMSAIIVGPKDMESKRSKKCCYPSAMGNGEGNAGGHCAFLTGIAVAGRLGM
jgi:hypothetical protein